MTDPRGKTWDYGYDSDGNRDSVTDPLGSETTWGFNELGWPTAMVSARGNALGATPADYTTSYTYNEFGDVLTITDPLSNVTTRGYDEGRNLTSVEDANSHETTYVYDDAGQLVEIHRPDSSVLANEYWDDGLLKTQTDGASNDVGYVYDAQGRLVSSTDAPGNTTGYGYDDGGNIVTREDPGGDCTSTPKVLCTTFTYDAADQLATVTYSDGITPDVTSVTYDDNGRRTALADSASGSMAWAYDSLGDLTSSTVNGDTTSYEYDLAGNVTSITYPNSGGTIGRGYDDAGRWTSVTDWASNTTTFDYDEDGHLTDTLYPGSVNEDIAAFDEAGRPTSTTFMADTTTLGSLTYTRDDVGLLTGETAVDIAGGTHTYGYNALDQLTTRDSTSTWTYDSADNLTATGAGAAQTFNAGNQICYQTASGSGSCGSPPAAATTFGFDPIGQRTSQANSRAGRTGYGFDQAQRLTTVTRSHTRVAMGADFSVEIKANGAVIAAGNNSSGQLGDGTTTASAAPVEVAGLTPGTVVSVAAGEDHALALLSDGTVVAWGDNSDGELGDNSTTSSSTPVAVSGLTGVVEISAGANFSVAVKNDGTVWTWGDNGSGQLGRGPGNYTSSTVPVQASGLSGVVDAAAGAFHAVAVKADGTVWAWGYGANGQLGNGVVANETVPQQVDGLNRVIDVAGGGVHTVALRADGTVYAWGDNDYGQLGDGTTTDAGTPVAVSGLAGAVAVDATNIATTALKADGTVYGWGTGNNNGTSASTVTSPAAITGTGAVTALGTGPTAYHTLLPSISGIVWAYGDDSSGQYAMDSTSQSATPRRTLIATPASVASGNGFSVHIQDDGTVAAAGANNVGQLGNNSTTDSSTPVTVSGLTAGTVVSVAAGEDHALAIINDGTVVAWGNNSDGQLGDNSTTNSSVPVAVSGISKAIAVAAGVHWSLAVTRDGTVYTWGDNSGGQLGVGSWTDSHVPVQVSSLTNVVAAEAGSDHAVALNADGTVYTWGWGGSGQLGNGSTSAQNAPVQVTAVSHIAAVSAGGLHSLALRQDGTVYAWGGNPYGELGDGTTTSSSSPVRVANLTDVVAIAAHNVGSQAIRADGTGWGWGAGGANGNSWSNTSSPVALSDVTGLAALGHGGTAYHALVTAQAGDVYAFGDNSTGAYGDSTTSSSPTAVDTGIDDRADAQPMTAVRQARYSYDADGQRRTKTTRAGATTYQWDQSAGLELLLTEAGADNTIRYLYGPGGLPVEQIDDDDTIRYYHHDQLGSTRLLADESGVGIANIGYDPYGTASANLGPTGSPMSYAGQYTDPETGLQYLRARYYDPATGQMLTRDPIGASTRDAYGYAARTPLNASDPSGMSSCGDWTDPGSYVDCAADAAGRGEDVAIATVNAPVTTVTAGANFFTGGDCGWDKHLTVVCEGGVLSDHSFSGASFTTGNTVNVPTRYQDFWLAHHDELIEHESNHSTQWAFLGLSFIPLYAIANRNGGCDNIFEQDAGLREGQYKCGGSALGTRNAPC
jgi:RHS repeat-associated protein